MEEREGEREGERAPRVLSNGAVHVRNEIRALARLALRLSLPVLNGNGGCICVHVSGIQSRRTPLSCCWSFEQEALHYSLVAVKTKQRQIEKDTAPTPTPTPLPDLPNATPRHAQAVAVRTSSSILRRQCRVCCRRCWCRRRHHRCGSPGYDGSRGTSGGSGGGGGRQESLRWRKRSRTGYRGRGDRNDGPRIRPFQAGPPIRLRR